jgi:aminoglycoside 6'-N-acetyltransferase I
VATNAIRSMAGLQPRATPTRNSATNRAEDCGVVLVAVRENGSLCGFAELAIRHDHVDGASSVPVAYLEGWYVDPDVRGGGIGRRLLEAAEGWAAARGLRELASDAELDNHRSIQTHRSCGFTEICRAVHFIKPISVNRELGDG